MTTRSADTPSLKSMPDILDENQKTYRDMYDQMLYLIRDVVSVIDTLNPDGSTASYRPYHEIFPEGARVMRAEENMLKAFKIACFLKSIECMIEARIEGHKNVIDNIDQVIKRTPRILGDLAFYLEYLRNNYPNAFPCETN